MKKLIVVVLSALAAQAQSTPPDLLGDWLGTLTYSGLNLRMALHFTSGADGKLDVKADFLDQGALGLPARLSQTGDTLRIDLTVPRASFEGKVDAAGEQMTGIYRQGPGATPLMLRKVDKILEPNRPQNPKRPFPYREEEVTYLNARDGVRLAGTLTLPPAGGPFPAVLLFTGSGAQDRDESLMGHKPFLVLADHLTRLGIAVLRVDDRGVGGSTGSLAEVTLEDLAGDALAGVAYLKHRKEIDSRKIGLIGHSEGALIAPMAAIRSKDVAFIVSMAGTGVNGEQVLYAQGDAMQRASGATDAAIQQRAEIQRAMFTIVREERDSATAAKKLRAALDAKLGSVSPQMEAEIGKILSPWMRYFLTYEPGETLRQVSCPVLAMNGELDRQVPPRQNLSALAAVLAASGNPDYAIVSLPKLNHLFQTAKTGGVDEYFTIEETMAPAALAVLSDWLLRHVR